jgi:hypothetical protein
MSYDNADMDLFLGAHGSYRWLTSECELGPFVNLCQEVVLGKLLAVTSIGSGVLIPTDEGIKAGWKIEGGIAYSPPIESVGQLPIETHKEYDGFHEWWVFTGPVNLGELDRGNVFERGPRAGRVFTFVNFLGFALHDRTSAGIADYFWRQIELIQPESYVADGDTCLTFVSRDATLFESVVEKLERSTDEDLPASS